MFLNAGLRDSDVEEVRNPVVKSNKPLGLLDSIPKLPVSEEKPVESALVHPPAAMNGGVENSCVICVGISY